MPGPTGATKEAIDAFVVDQFKNLKRIARSYTSRRRNSPAWTSDVAEELFSYMLGELYSGRQSVAAVAANGPVDLLRWCTAVMGNSMRGTSGFSRSRGRLHAVDPLETPSAWVRTSSDGDDPDYLDGRFLGEPRPVSHPICAGDDDHQPAVDEAASFLEAELLTEGMHPDRVAQFLAVAPCAQAMPIHQRVLVELYFVDGLSIRQIAAQKGIPPSSVFEMVRTAKRELRACIDSRKQPLL